MSDDAAIPRIAAPASTNPVVDDELAFAERAAARANWPVRIGRLAEMEGDGKDLPREELDLSATTTVEERFAMMWQLAKDAWAMRGEPVGEPPYPRAPVQLIRGFGKQE